MIVFLLINRKKYIDQENVNSCHQMTPPLQLLLFSMFLERLPCTAIGTPAGSSREGTNTMFCGTTPMGTPATKGAALGGGGGVFSKGTGSLSGGTWKVLESKWLGGSREVGVNTRGSSAGGA